MLKIEFYAMGSHMQATASGERGLIERQLREVPGWFDDWERQLSRFQPTSELGQLNQAAGRWFRPSDLLYENLQIAQLAAAYSDGLFDPSMLMTLESIGYDRSFERLLHERHEPGELASIPAAGWQLVEFDESAKRVRLPLGVGIDLGGIAKAWAAAKAAARLGELGPALVDAGGDIAISGPRARGEAWPIALASPFQAAKDLGWLWVEQGVVATSGRDIRRWQVNGQWRHHLLDPRTGWPAETDVLTATVVGEKCWQAEAGAKAALLLGAREGLKWLDGKKELEGILVLESGELEVTEGISRYGWTG